VERNGDVYLRVIEVESGVWGWIDADVTGLGFAGLSCCPRFAQGFEGWWKSWTGGYEGSLPRRVAGMGFSQTETGHPIHRIH